MSAETIIDRLWDSTEPPAKARDALYAYVTRIRGHLRETAGLPVTLGSQAGGYLLKASPEAIDLHLFRLKRRQASALAESGDARQAVTLLRGAERLFKGEPLTGLPGDWFAHMRQSLEEERRAATLHRVGLELELGRHADLVSELRLLSAEFPFDETVIEYHITALYRCGRVTEALTLCREISRGLRAQGMDPGAPLSLLHERVLRRDPLLGVTPTHRRPPGRGQPRNLPAVTGTFTGRAQETSALTDEAEGTAGPLIRIVAGMSGAGKTALALHAAREASAKFPDAQVYVGFNAHSPGRGPLDTGAALGELLRGLDVPASSIPVSVPARAALWRAEIAGRRAVVVLDDVPGAQQIRPLLPVSGRSLVLITTRRRLHGLPGTSTLHLEPLPPGDAATLFARVAGPAADDDDLAAAAARLCGFLPLAIEVAAGKLRQASPPTLAELVEALAKPPEDPDHPLAVSGPVASAFSVSYLGLAERERKLFRLLAAHPCPQITGPAAAALAAISPDGAAVALATLADHHLVESRPEGRFGMHDLLRDYAQSRASAEDSEAERRQAAGRVLDYYISAADLADRVLYPHRRRRPVRGSALPGLGPTLETPSQAQAWMRAELANLVHAAQYADAHEWPVRCADMAHAISLFLETSGHWDEAVTVQQIGLRAAQDHGDPVMTAEAELDVARVSQHVGRYDDALSHAARSRSHFRALGDQRGEAETLDRIGMVHSLASRFLDALAYYEEARSIYQDLGDQQGVASVLGHAGIATASLGRLPAALELFTQALSLYRRTGNRRGEATTLNNVGDVQRLRGFYRDAMHSYETAAEIFRHIGGTHNQALLAHNVGMVQHYRGRHDDALSSYRRALTTYRALGDLCNQAGALNDIGAAYQSKYQHGEALAHYQQAHEIATDIGDRREMAVALRGIGGARAGLGRHDEAIRHYQEARKLAREISDPYQEAKAIVGIAETSLHEEGTEAARIYLWQALAIFEQIGVPEAAETRVRLHALGARGA